MKRRKPPLKGLFLKNGEGANESLLFFIWRDLANSYNKRTEQNRTEQNRTEQNRTEQNRTEQIQAR